VQCWVVDGFVAVVRLLRRGPRLVAGVVLRWDRVAGAGSVVFGGDGRMLYVVVLGRVWGCQCVFGRVEVLCFIDGSQSGLGFDVGVDWIGYVWRWKV